MSGAASGFRSDAESAIGELIKRHHSAGSLTADDRQLAIALDRLVRPDVYRGNGVNAVISRGVVGGALHAETEFAEHRGDTASGNAVAAPQNVDATVQLNNPGDQHGHERFEALQALFRGLNGLVTSQQVEIDVQDRPGYLHRFRDLVNRRANRVARIIHDASPSFDARSGAGDTASVGVDPAGAVEEAAPAAGDLR